MPLWCYLRTTSIESNEIALPRGEERVWNFFLSEITSRSILLVENLVFVSELSDRVDGSYFRGDRELNWRVCQGIFSFYNHIWLRWLIDIQKIPFSCPVISQIMALNFSFRRKLCSRASPGPSNFDGSVELFNADNVLSYIFGLLYYCSTRKGAKNVTRLLLFFLENWLHKLLLTFKTLFAALCKAKWLRNLHCFWAVSLDDWAFLLR